MKKDRFVDLLKALFRYNFRTLFLFELYYKLLAYGLFTPLLIWILEFAIKKAGLNYLSAAALGTFLLSPYTWAALLFILVLLACYVIADMTAVMICVDCAKRGEYVRGQTLVWEACKAVARLFYWRNLPMLLLILVQIPILGLSFLSGYVTTIQVPDFWQSTLAALLREYWVLFLSIFVTLAAFRFLYAVFYYVIEKKNFKEACRKSHYLIYRADFSEVLRLFLWQLAGYAAYAVLIALLILAIIGISSLLREAEYVYAVMLLVIDWMMKAVNVLFSCIAVPLTTLFLSHRFYRNKKTIGEPEQTVLCRTREYAIGVWQRRLGMLITILILIVVNMRNVERLAQGALSDATSIAHRTDITAHRGYSSTYPENTLQAFEAAMDSGADWIELDVQQTADGEIIVMHDSDFKRTAGLGRNVWEMNYDEIRELDVGKWKGEEFAGTGVSTLAEVLELCHGRIRLNIEIKPTGHERDFVSRVIDLIREYDYEGDCVVASMSYRVLEEVKNYDGGIETVYVMRSVYGSFYELQYADNYSIRSNYITSHMVENIHAQGKKIYAWTVNTERTMERMLQFGVDNLITDYPVMARQKVFEAENSTVLSRYVRMLTKWFYLK